MPYKSDRQRRYLHAQHPDIAARWDEEIRQSRKKKVSKGVLVPVEKKDDRKATAMQAGGAGSMLTAFNSNRIQHTVNDISGAARMRNVRREEEGLRHAKQTRQRPNVGAFGRATGPREDYVNLRRQRKESRPADPGQAGAARRRDPRNVSWAQEAKRRTSNIDAARAKAGRQLMTRGHVNALTLGAATAGVTGMYAGTRRKVAKKMTTRDVDAAAAGSAAATSGYYAVGYGTKGIDRRNAAKIKADPKLAERMQQHRDKHGIGPRTQAGDKRWTQFHRQYPKDLPGGKFKRVLSHTHGGKRGLAVMTGTAATGGYAGMQTDRKLVRKRRSDNLLYTRQRKTSPRRVAQLGAGSALVAYGASHSGIVAGGLAYGSRSAPNQFLRDSARVAERVRASTERATGAAANAIGRRLPGAAKEVTRIPARYRPGVALVTGTTLFRSARPVTKDVYRPYTVQGW